MDGTVKGSEDTSLMEPPWKRMMSLVRRGGARVKKNHGHSREVGEMRFVMMLIKFPEAGDVVAGLRNMF